MTDAAKKVLGLLLSRLVPNGDFKVLEYDNYRIVWKDARPQPTEAQIEAEYLVYLAELSAKVSEENLKKTKKDFLISFKGKTIKDTEVKDILSAMIEVLF